MGTPTQLVSYSLNRKGLLTGSEHPEGVVRRMRLNMLVLLKGQKDSAAVGSPNPASRLSQSGEDQGNTFYSASLLANYFQNIEDFCRCCKKCRSQQTARFLQLFLYPLGLSQE